MLNASEAIGHACDSQGDGRLRQADFIQFRKGESLFLEKQYQFPETPNNDERYALEYTHYNAINEDEDGVTLEEYGTIWLAVHDACEKKLKLMRAHVERYLGEN